MEEQTIKDDAIPKIDNNVKKQELEFKLNLNKETKNVDLELDKNEKNTVNDLNNSIVKEVSDSIVNYLTSNGQTLDKPILDRINQAAVNLYLDLTKEMAKINPIISQRADDIMNNGDPIDFILNVHSKIHIGDRSTAHQLLVSIGCQSVLNTEGIHAKLSGGSGKGKTHCTKAMAHLIPPEYKLVGKVSDKALFYKKDLLAGTVIFSDDVNLSENMEGVIKEATSNYQTTTIYGTVIDKNYVQLQIPQRLTFWLTSVNDDQSQQLLNRTFSGGVDESAEQDERVWKFFTNNALMGVYEFDLTEDVEVCREIIRRIKQQLFFVRIPFANDIEWNTKVDDNRRNMGIFLDMIKSCAVLRYQHRDMEVINGKNFINATLQDFTDAKKLYDTRGKTRVQNSMTMRLKSLNTYIQSQ
jgi:hypothetical protein